MITTSEHQRLLDLFPSLTSERILVLDLGSGSFLKEQVSGGGCDGFSTDANFPVSLYAADHSCNKDLPFCTLTEDIPYLFEVPLNHQMNSRVWYYFANHFTPATLLARARRVVLIPISMKVDKATVSAASDWSKAQYRFSSHSTDRKLEAETFACPTLIDIGGETVVYARDLITNRSFLCTQRGRTTYQIITSLAAPHFFYARETNVKPDRTEFTHMEPDGMSTFPIIELKYGKSTRQHKQVTLPDFDFEVNPYDQKQLQSAKMVVDNEQQTHSVFSLEAAPHYCNSDFIHTLPLLMSNPLSRETLLKVKQGDIINLRGGPHQGAYFASSIIQKKDEFPYILLKPCI